MQTWKDAPAELPDYYVALVNEGPATSSSNDTSQGSNNTSNNDSSGDKKKS